MMKRSHTLKMADKKVKDTEEKIKIEVLEKILKEYPELEQERINLTNKILEKQVIAKPFSKVADKFIHNDKPYYRDSEGSIWSENMEVVGVWTYKEGVPKYYFFDKTISKPEIFTLE
jgi:hypothetical protein